jgi:ATP-dependent Zn protease
LEVDFEKMSLVKDDFKEIDRELVSKSEIEAKIQVYLSGIICVEDIFKEKFSNATNDIQKAKKLANKMINEYGMGDRIIASETEILQVLETAVQSAKLLYTSQKEVVLRVQEKLLEQEIITKEEIMEIRNEIL